MKLAHLPAELLVAISEHMPPADVLALAATCRRLRAVLARELHRRGRLACVQVWRRVLAAGPSARAADVVRLLWSRAARKFELRRCRAFVVGSLAAAGDAPMAAAILRRHRLALPCVDSAIFGRSDATYTRWWQLVWAARTGALGFLQHGLQAKWWTVGDLCNTAGHAEFCPENPGVLWEKGGFVHTLFREGRWDMLQCAQTACPAFAWRLRECLTGVAPGSGHACGILLRAACSGGSLDLVRWLWGHMRTALPVSPAGAVAFRHACEHGHAHIAQFLLDNHGLSVAIADLLPDCLRKACSSGHVELARMLTRRFMPDDTLWRECLHLACAAGQLNVLRALAPRRHHRVASAQLFKLAVVHGKMDVAAFLVRDHRLTMEDLSLGHADAGAFHDTLGSLLASAGMSFTTPLLLLVDMAHNAAAAGWRGDARSWAALHPWFQPHTRKVVRRVCASGDVDVLRVWHGRIGVAPLDVRDEVEWEGSCNEGLRTACMNGHLPVLQFLFDTLGAQQACPANQVPLGRADVLERDARCVLVACLNGHAHVVDYLVTKFALTAAELAPLTECHALQLDMRTCHVAVARVLHDRLGMGPYFHGPRDGECRELALHRACRRQPSVADLEFLVRACGIQASDVVAARPLPQLGRQGNMPALHYLLARFGDCVGDQLPRTLRAACGRGHLSLARYLLGDGGGADMRCPCSLKGDSKVVRRAVRAACIAGHAHVAQYLCARFHLK